MSTSKSNALNLSVVFPWLLTLLTAAIGIWQFTAQQSQANRTPFLQKQLELSFQASETASRLATETDPVEWEKARLAFWRLYWGPLSIVEDRAVESAMVELGKSRPSATSQGARAADDPSRRSFIQSRARGAAPCS